jgi:hypothetical protein
VNAFAVSYMTFFLLSRHSLNIYHMSGSATGARVNVVIKTLKISVFMGLLF